LRDFLKEKLLCPSPGVLLLIDGKRDPSESLVFPVFPEDYQGDGVFEAVLQMIDWHLPPHYSFSGVPKDSEIARTFFPL
jgi:hypothetical protein